MSRGENSVSFATERVNVTKYKIVFVGDQGVGKSSIINSFTKNEFDSTHNPTVGIDFVSKTLNIKGKTVRLQLWDTAGQERFRSLIPSYLKDCNAAFVVYDIASQNSFQAVNKWLDFVRQSRGSDCLIYILGNKLDLEAERTVRTETAEELAKAQNIALTEVSAKSGANLGTVFKSLCSNLLKTQIEEFDLTQSSVKIPKGPGSQSPSKVETQVATSSQNKRATTLKAMDERPQQVRSICC